MKRVISIIEGNVASSYFGFVPVRVKKKNRITEEDVEFLDERISIEEGDIECFLKYFLYKYFDKELYINKHRYAFGYIHDFDWYSEENFYTYESMREMLAEIMQTAELLENDYDNPALAEVKKGFSIYYLCAPDEPDYIAHKEENVENHKGVIIDFYKRFVARMYRMLDEYPMAHAISVLGV